MTFFWKADAKVRTIFELPKLFRRNFQKKVFQWRFKTLTSFQYFNSSAFLSRKRVQKYCFITYPPNIRNTFLQTFCIRSHNSLILKRCRKTKKREHSSSSILYTLIDKYARVYKVSDNYHSGNCPIYIFDIFIIFQFVKYSLPPAFSLYNQQSYIQSAIEIGIINNGKLYIELRLS